MELKRFIQVKKQVEGCGCNGGIYVRGTSWVLFYRAFEGNYIDVITEEDVAAGKYTFASHGYSPKKENYETVFIATGKGIQPNRRNS